MNHPLPHIDQLPNLPADAGLSYNPSLARTPTSIGGHTSATIEDVGQPITPPGIPRPEHEFDLIKPLAQGGFGEVWIGHQQALHRIVAVKRLRNHLLAHEESTEVTSHPIETAFYQEALITANLEHPNIVPIYDMGLDPAQRRLLAMKLVRGTLWRDSIRTDFPAMDVGAFLRKHLTILLETAQAVAFAHARGIIHRDLKPSQVMVGEFGEVQLMDWGLAVIVDTEAAREHMPHLLAAGPIPTTADAFNPAGTPAYMAPEQTDPTPDRLSRQTDVFLLGATLFQLLCGRAPYARLESREAMYRAAAGKAPSLRELAGDRYLPPELAALTKWAMSPDPLQRPASVLAFSNALRDFLDNASRRWESRSLTFGVAETLEASAHDPQRVLAHLHALDCAEGLWPENPELARLRSLAMAAYTAHLTVGDPEVAAALLKASKVPDPSLREYLAASLERAWTHRTNTRRLLLQLAILGVLALLLIGAALLAHALGGG